MTKKEITTKDLALSIDKLSQTVEKGFKRVDKKIDDLAASTHAGFSNVEGRLGKLEKSMDWVKDVLEKHSGTLLRLDQERFFTINHVHRLEEEINRIKEQLKIA